VTSSLRLRVLGSDGVARSVAAVRVGAPWLDAAEGAAPLVVTDDVDAGLARLADGGVLYVVAPPAQRRRARAAAARAGLRPAGSFLHVPGWEASAAIAELDGGAAFLLDRVLAPSAKRRLVRALVRAPGLAASVLPGVGLAFTRDGTRAAAWLGDGAPVVTQSWRDDAPAVVLLVRDGEVARVAKLASDGGLEREAEALRTLAAAAGVAAPALVSCADGVLVQTGVRGEPAQRLLGRSPSSLAAVLGALAGWLAAWQRATARTTDAGLCVAVHDDLTTANVLLGVDGELGVIDWGLARDDGLPLTDFLYAAADAVSATTRHRDRVAAFGQAFLEDGPTRELVTGHARDLARGLELDPDAIATAWHACWTQHAANEARRGDEGGPFRAIASLARDADLGPLSPSGA
jgi:tRNA A-37 threonylcarbamoyl transferase component Bud32